MWHSSYTGLLSVFKQHHCCNWLNLTGGSWPWSHMELPQRASQSKGRGRTLLHKHEVRQRASLSWLQSTLNQRRKNAERHSLTPNYPVVFKGILHYVVSRKCWFYKRFTFVCIIKLRDLGSILHVLCVKAVCALFLFFFIFSYRVKAALNVAA